MTKRRHTSSRAEDIPRDEFAFETLRFFIPAAVADAMDIQCAVTRATAAGFTEIPLEISGKMSPSPEMRRVICPRFFAAFLVEEMNALGHRTEGDLRREASEAALIGLLAIAGRI